MRSTFGFVHGLSLATVLLCAPPAAAWHDPGHNASGAIADRFIDPAVRPELERLLAIAAGKHGLRQRTLADAADWADYHARETLPRSRAWHFVNVHKDVGRYDPAACAAHAYGGEPRPNECVIAKIAEFRRVLATRLRADGTPADDERALALLYLAHFVGDLHQPLHCGDNRDSGGNGTKIHETRTRVTTSLHGYWDGIAVARIGTGGQSLGAMLAGEITVGQQQEWQRGTPEDWCGESVRHARDYAYRYGAWLPSRQAYLANREYEDAARDITRVRLQQAGVRIAQVLNEALAPAQ